MLDPKLSHYRGLAVSQWSFYVSERAIKFGLLKKLHQTPLCLVHFFEWIKHSATHKPSPLLTLPRSSLPSLPPPSLQRPCHQRRCCRCCCPCPCPCHCCRPNMPPPSSPLPFSHLSHIAVAHHSRPSLLPISLACHSRSSLSLITLARRSCAQRFVHLALARRFCLLLLGVGNHTYYDSCGTACGSAELKKHAELKNRQHAELKNRQHVELMKKLTDSVRRAAHRIIV